MRDGKYGIFTGIKFHAPFMCPVVLQGIQIIVQRQLIIDAANISLDKTVVSKFSDCAVDAIWQVTDKDKSGPKMVPCGIPEGTGDHHE